MFLLLIILQVYSSHANESVVKSVEEINQGNIAPSVKCTEDELQLCATDLCGAPSSVTSQYLTNEKFEEFMTAEALPRLREVETVAREQLGKALERNRKFFGAVDELVKLNRHIPDFDNWNDEKWKAFAGGLVRSDYQLFIKIFPGKTDNYEEISACDSQCRSLIKNHVSEFYRSKYGVLKTSAVGAGMIEEVFPKCLSMFAMVGSKLSDKDASEPFFQEVRKTFSEKISPFMSQHSRDAWKEYSSVQLQNIYGEHSKTTDEFIAEFRAWKPIETIKTGAEDLFLTMKDEFYDTFDPNKMSPAGNLYQCLDFTSLGWDSFSPDYNGKDVIAVSPFSCTYRAQGAGFHSHELGHALSEAFRTDKLSSSSKDWFIKKRECVRLSDPSEPAAEEDSFTGDKLSTEEDHADAMEYFVQKNSGVLGNCSLLPQNSERSSFLRLSLDQDGVENHSPALLRIIREAKAKGKTIPPSCKAILRHYNYGIEPCL